MKSATALLVAAIAPTAYGQDLDSPDLPDRNESVRRAELIAQEIKLVTINRQATSPYGFLALDLEEKNRLKVTVGGGNIDGAASLTAMKYPKFGPSFSASNDGLSLGVGVSVPLIAQASAQIVVTPLRDFGNVQFGANYLSAGVEVTVRTGAVLEAVDSAVVRSLTPTSQWLSDGVSAFLFSSWPGAPLELGF